ncbi:MAG: DUF389 domain-containing protein [Bacteroidales bacterium]|nr:DUF389 domain-containing protein [Bacteroidales bacterium]
MAKRSIRKRLFQLVDMSDDLDREGASVSIRKGIHFRGANVFILACAIIIASVGLNVNSIPVIIGAMLISPVMAPIVGFGFGLAIHDSSLVRASLKNFIIMVSISIGASFIYFLLSPLRMVNPTELLARTNPTLYDVLIALFGGFAGILELSRKKKGTVLSGVAIATALMPPLCTIGYGLSVFNVRYIFGAFYLFIINSIFISLATYLTVKYLKYPIVSDNGSKGGFSRRYVIVFLIVLIIPSIFSAVRIVRESNFDCRVQHLVVNHSTIGRSYIYDHKTHFSARHATVELFVAGPVPTELEMESFYNAAEGEGVSRDQIVVSDNSITASISDAENEIIKDAFKLSEKRQEALADSVKRLSQSLSAYQSQDDMNDAVAREIIVQYPTVNSVLIGDARTLTSGNNVQSGTHFTVLIETSAPLSQTEIDKLSAWLKVRLEKEQVMVIQTSVGSQ